MNEPQAPATPEPQRPEDTQPSVAPAESAASTEASPSTAATPTSVPSTDLPAAAPAAAPEVPQNPHPAPPVVHNAPPTPPLPPAHMPPPITGPATHPLAAQTPSWARPPQQQPSFSPGGYTGPPPSQGFYTSPSATYPPTTQFPAPATGPTAVPAWRKPLAIGAMVAALVLGSASVGGVAGYLAADGNTTSSSSSPSTAVADGATVADVAAKVQPSVVVISTEQAEGSGVVLDTSGNILTNNHVVSTAANGRVQVKFADGTTATGRVVGTSPENDIAVVNVGASDELSPISWGDSEGLRVGDTVLALGSPLGLEGSVSAGIVSALDRSISVGSENQNPFQREAETPTTLAGLIQTDAAINSGNSGGALVNGRGELVGVNTAIATDGSGSGSIGVGFAIPSNTAKQVAEQLIAQGS
ncbi:trypsin-like peptidase domain-containing protein [Phytomonospora endophytica]|uniref:Putative serine protease PepD n=1 Tax=Phytomonospora endophytica TaxID=714109 RepID=A0A841F9T8_9ACTN|nr:trypsin-like peptidase domain-containing protein [Phytomonospora endophytica]MBB6033016.1 putative serine protease PepD [Phytomonospora endophytica]GIG65242.1 serine protease [Phytomonospora endophytica]